MEFKIKEISDFSEFENIWNRDGGDCGQMFLIFYNKDHRSDIYKNLVKNKQTGQFSFSCHGQYPIIYRKSNSKVKNSFVIGSPGYTKYEAMIYSFDIED